MGMYTGLRGKIELKPQVAALMTEWYDDEIVTDEVAKHFDWNVWEYVASHLEDVAIKHWADMPRSSFIPNGMVCYMPDDWDECRDISGNTLTVCCSLKNYNGEIAMFIEQVLPVIADAWELEERYEEDSESTFHYNEGH